MYDVIDFEKVNVCWIMTYLQNDRYMIVVESPGIKSFSSSVMFISSLCLSDNFENIITVWNFSTIEQFLSFS